MEPSWPATTTTGPAEPPTTYRPEGDLAKGGRVGRETVAAGWRGGGAGGGGGGAPGGTCGGGGARPAPTGRPPRRGPGGGRRSAERDVAGAYVQVAVVERDPVVGLGADHDRVVERHVRAV